MEKESGYADWSMLQVSEELGRLTSGFLRGSLSEDEEQQYRKLEVEYHSRVEAGLMVVAEEDMARFGPVERGLRILRERIGI